MKKAALLVLIIICAACVVFGGLYMKDSGVFEQYPDAEYLSPDEAAERPLYAQLSKKEQAVYTALYRGICGKQTEIALPVEVDGETYSKLYCILEKQEGALFYLDSSYYTAQKIRNAEIIYREIPGNEPMMSVTLESCASEVTAAVGGMGEYGKALYIHDYIIKNCTYEVNMDNDLGATAYGCLVGGSANCEGYAKAFVYLAGKAGVTSIVVTGMTDEGENHAWNQVEIGGEWYNLDVTWDDLDNPSDKRHTYFLCADSDFLKTHTADNLAGGTFSCTSSDENYFVKNDLFISNMDDADRILRREISLGTDMVELRLADSGIYHEFMNEYFENERIFDIIMEYSSPILGASVAVNIKENEKENCIAVYLE